jgi:hypothetical protein
MWPLGLLFIRVTAAGWLRNAQAAINNHSIKRLAGCVDRKDLPKLKLKYIVYMDLSHIYPFIEWISLIG